MIDVFSIKYRAAFLANKYYHAGEYEKAAKFYIELAKSSNDNIVVRQAIYNCAVAYIKMDRLDRAHELLRAYCIFGKLNPTSALLYNLAYVEYMLEDYEAAYQHSLEGLAIDPLDKELIVLEKELRERVE